MPNRAVNRTRRFVASSLARILPARRLPYSLGVMSIATRQHNTRGHIPNWWRRYFWSRHEYWAKHAVHRAAHRAKAAKLVGSRRYFFWDRVCQRAATHCERVYGSVPKILVRRPIGRSAWSLSSPEVSK